MTMNEEESQQFVEDLMIGYVDAHGSIASGPWTEEEIEMINKLDELTDVLQEE